MTNTIKYHEGRPDITLTEYIRNERIALGRAVARKYKVYLDIRFWILLREVEMGRNNDQNLRAFLLELKKKVDSGFAICPISEAVFFELMKQSDIETLSATAELIDRLSHGVTLIHHAGRVQQELCNAVYSRLGAKDLIPLSELVWTKLAYVLGEMHPDVNLACQKAFFDHLWNVPLAKMVEYLGTEVLQSPLGEWDGLAQKLNASNKEYASQIRNFKQLYETEFRGSLSEFRNDLILVFKEAKSAGYHESAADNPVTRMSKDVEFYKLIRTLHIRACCYAAVRWDQRRLLKGNDFMDFHHAEAAIGYCDLFVTEKSLETMLKQNHLKLGTDFDCQVESKPRAALKALNDAQARLYEVKS